MSGGKGKVVAGVFIGMVLGIAAAGGVAWYVLQKKPNVFTNKDQAKPAPQVAPVSVIPPVVAPVSAPVAASGVGEAKQHFEFYKVLTDKPDAAAHQTNPKTVTPKEPAVAKVQPAPSAAASKEMYYVQAGSFQNVGDAEKLKAKLAFSGFEATVQTVAIPDKGEWHRVRLGPYNNSEAGKAIAALKQDGIIATQLHAQ
jgi:cell division protein FtsN